MNGLLLVTPDYIQQDDDRNYLERIILQVEEICKQLIVCNNYSLLNRKDLISYASLHIYNV